MKKFLFLIVASLFVFSGVFGAESFTDENVNSNEQVEFSKEKADSDQAQAKKIDKKELRKLKKEARKKIKKRKTIKEVLNNMFLVGGILLIGGLLLYLIVGGAPWLGIIVMVIGVVILLYGALKKFF